eukprot:7341581-Alexandrium_andersonii.AAC.1
MKSATESRSRFLCSCVALCIIAARGSKVGEEHFVLVSELKGTPLAVRSRIPLPLTMNAHRA